MKIFLIGCLCCVLFPISTHAQFTFSVGAGYQIFQTSESPMIILEPKLNLSTRARLGLSSALPISQGTKDRATTNQLDFNYKPFSTSRFYVGTGIGVSTSKTVRRKYDPSAQRFADLKESHTSLSIAPKLGFQGAYDLYILYNFGPSSYAWYIGLGFNKVLGWRKLN